MRKEWNVIRKKTNQLEETRAQEPVSLSVSWGLQAGKQRMPTEEGQVPAAVLAFVRKARFVSFTNHGWGWAPSGEWSGPLMGTGNSEDRSTCPQFSQWTDPCPSQNSVKSGRLSDCKSVNVSCAAFLLLMRKTLNPHGVGHGLFSVVWTLSKQLMKNASKL